jgi:hypothetical protein
MRPFLALVLLLAGLSSGAAQDSGVVATPDINTNPNRFDILGAMTARYPRTFAFVKEEFPDDYATLVSTIAGIGLTDADQRTAMLAGFEQMKEMRARYADKIRFAPTISHVLMLQLVAEFHELVLKDEGPAVCGRFASDGSAALFAAGLAEKYAERLDLQSFAYLDAVVKAIEAPDDNGVATPEDWSEVMGEMIKAGAPRSFVAAIARPDPRDPDLCPALSALFRATSILATPAAGRVRADLAGNLAGY